MRIRKRQVPLPLSSLSPVPLSDPLFNQLNNDHYSSPPPPPQPVVQLHHTHHGDHPIQPKPSSNPVLPQISHPHPQPSDHDLNRRPNSPIGAASGDEQNQKKNKRDYCLEFLKGGEEEDDDDDDETGREGEKKGNDIRKESMLLGAETLAGLSSISSHRSGAIGRWYEGEKAFPLKKRRGSFERGGENITIMGNNDKKMKTKMNKKCGTTQQNDDEKLQQDRETKQGLGDNSNVNIGNTTSGARNKKTRGGALMEGSRCSRVNGRGWRCCQQTLVGYSLCEHHLGKGRLRSMTSVRSRSMAASTTSAPTTETERSKLSSTSSSEAKPAMLLDDTHHKGATKGHENEDEEEDEEEEKPLIVTKKRMKLGIVKARSMSSLLGQTSSAIVAVADDGDNK